VIQRITIPNWRPVRDNQLVGVHWTKRKRLKDGDAEFVATYARQADTAPATGKRRVSLEIVLVGRQQETDPWAYLKSLLDALVKCKLLVDDSSEYVEWGGTTYTRGSEPSTTIILKDIV